MPALRSPLLVLAAVWGMRAGLASQSTQNNWLGYHDDATGRTRCSHKPDSKPKHPHSEPEPTKDECRSWDCNWKDGGCFRYKGWLDAKFLGVGWKKTGTTSLAAAYDALHLTPHCECDDLSRMKAMQDSGLSLSVARIAQAKRDLPAAKFILTVRPVSTWNASIVHWTSFRHNSKYYELKMGGALVGTTEFIDGYKHHNKAVRSLFRDSPERLLELNFEKEDPVTAMRRLCDFVDKALRVRHADVCDSPFPHMRDERPGEEGKYKDGS